MEFFSLTPEDYADEWTVEVWLENVEAVNLFCQIGSQWRVGPSGPYGLDYNVLYHRLDRMGLTPERYEELEDEVRTLESGALEEMRKE